MTLCEPLADASFSSVIDDVPHPRDVLGTWWVAHLRAGRGAFHVEHRYSADLAAKGIEHYLPLQKVRRVVRNGVKQLIERPVFCGYLFFAVQTDDQLYEATHASNPSRPDLLRVANQRQLVDDISRFWEIQQAGQLVEAFKEFGPGTYVEVKGGHPLRGQKAWVRSRDARKGIVTLSVAILGQSTAVEIGAEYLELA